jgi:hypothetical protein
MGQTFSRRRLAGCGDLAIKLPGEAACVEFDWEFEALRRDTGGVLESSGRESQMRIKLPGNGWRIAHVHSNATSACSAIVFPEPHEEL